MRVDCLHHIARVLLLVRENFDFTTRDEDHYDFLIHSIFITVLIEFTFFVLRKYPEKLGPTL